MRVLHGVAPLAEGLGAGDDAASACDVRKFLDSAAHSVDLLLTLEQQLPLVVNGAHLELVKFALQPAAQDASEYLRALLLLA